MDKIICPTCKGFGEVVPSIHSVDGVCPTCGGNKVVQGIYPHYTPDVTCPTCGGSGDSGYRGGGGDLETARRKCSDCHGTGGNKPTLADSSVREALAKVPASRRMVESFTYNGGAHSSEGMAAVAQLCDTIAILTAYITYLEVKYEQLKEAAEDIVIEGDGYISNEQYLALRAALSKEVS